MKHAFEITSNKGFHLTFPNGLTLSVQFGPMNYCENHSADFNYSDKSPAQSNDCEIGIWDSNKKWITDVIIHNGSDVKGHVSITELVDIINKCAAHK